LPLPGVLVVVPPSLPTGTVSQPSAGTRTFPPDSDADADRARVPAGSANDTSHPSTPQPSLPSTGVVSRREHDVSLARANERVAELEAENDALRDYIETQAAERRAVIERYERILDRRDATYARAEQPSGTPAEQTAGVAGTLRSAAAALRSRLSALVRRD
jgi:hypothetical protein